MGKPSLLYASPFSPMKSGISDYSEELIQDLAKKFDITLYTDNYHISNEIDKKFEVVRNGRDKIDFSLYDYKIYNIGNNPEYHDYIYECCLKYPGMVILHDMVLYYLFIGYYQKRGLLYSKTYEHEGLEEFLKLKHAVKENGPDLLAQKHMAEKLSLNNELLKSDNKIMVHSDYAYHKILETNLVEKQRLAKINQFFKGEDSLITKAALFEKYNIPQDAYVVASLGNIGTTKLNHEVCKAVQKLSRDGISNLRYVMVGEGNYVDQYIDGKIIMKTGYVDAEEFNGFLEHSDLIFNLRNPSMGETSRTMLQIMEKGKVRVINEGGWFSEIPDECAIKVSLDHLDEELKKVLKEMMSNPQKAGLVSKRAKKYIQDEYSGQKIVEQISEFICSK